MSTLLLEIKAAVAGTPEPAVSLSPPQLEAFERRYDEGVQAGIEANPIAASAAEVKKRGRPKQPPPLNLAMRLHDFKGQVLAFMYDFGVPFDNNQGKRDIRNALDGNPFIPSPETHWKSTPSELSVELSLDHPSMPRIFCSWRKHLNH